MPGHTRCWVTLLPLSAGGAWVDYVYALVSAELGEGQGGRAKKAKKAPEPEPEPVAEEVARTDRGGRGAAGADDESSRSLSPNKTRRACAEQIEEPVESRSRNPSEDAEDEPVAAAVAKAAPGFSKLLDSIAGLTGFYGSQPVKVEPAAPNPSRSSTRLDDEPEAAPKRAPR